MILRSVVTMAWLAVSTALLAGCVTSTTSTTATTSTTQTSIAQNTGSAFDDDPSYNTPTYPYANAYLTIQGTAGNEQWPNNGEMRIYSFGWGGKQPQAAPVATDTIGQPILPPGETPTLNVQKRRDEFSPLLQKLFEQNTEIEVASFTIDPQTAPKTTYNLHNARVVSMRPVGPQTGTIPPSEEIVLVFSRVTIE